MSVLVEYICSAYLTLLILLTLTVMMAANRDIRLKDMHWIRILMLLTFLASLCEYVEQWCDNYQKSYRILYYKSAAVYILYPLIALLLLYLTGSVKHRLPAAIPQIVTAVLALLDIAGTGIIYQYGSEHQFISGPLRSLPFGVEIFYGILLGIGAFRLFQDGEKSRGIILTYMMGSSLITLGAVWGIRISNQAVPAAVALELLIYYFYLAAIQYRKVQDALAAKQLELERKKNNLLLAQIRPHFINNILAVIRSLCFESADRAAEMIDHFSAYLRENVKQVDDMRLVPFVKEMESVDNYLYLEMQRFPGKIQVEKHFGVTEFSVPPLALQTLVENAVRHGISMTGTKGTIVITTTRSDGGIVITIKDDGKGFDTAATEFDGTNHVGIRNVMDRVDSLLGGTVTVESEIRVGTKVTIRIPGEAKA